MERITIVIQRAITRGESKLNNMDEDIEKYWKHQLDIHLKKDEDESLCDELTDLLEEDLKDKDDLAEEIFQLLFNSEDITFWDCLDMPSAIMPTDYLRMVEYFNTYYEENFGVECCVYKDLTQEKVYLHYAHTYALQNGIQDRIREWLDENIQSAPEIEQA